MFLSCLHAIQYGSAETAGRVKVKLPAYGSMSVPNVVMITEWMLSNSAEGMIHALSGTVDTSLYEENIER